MLFQTVSTPGSPESTTLQPTSPTKTIIKSRRQKLQSPQAESTDLVPESRFRKIFFRNRHPILFMPLSLKNGDCSAELESCFYICYCSSDLSLQHIKQIRFSENSQLSASASRLYFKL